jgi:hypothetical protein
VTLARIRLPVSPHPAIRVWLAVAVYYTSFIKSWQIDELYMQIIFVALGDEDLGARTWGMLGTRMKEGWWLAGDYRAGGVVGGGAVRLQGRAGRDSIRETANLGFLSNL